jgi:hypothetical protein
VFESVGLSSGRLWIRETIATRLEATAGHDGRRPERQGFNSPRLQVVNYQQVTGIVTRLPNNKSSDFRRVLLVSRDTLTDVARGAKICTAALR